MDIDTPALAATQEIHRGIVHSTSCLRGTVADKYSVVVGRCPRGRMQETNKVVADLEENCSP